MLHASLPKRSGTPPAVLAGYARAFKAGAECALTLEDALLVGLYLGEGSKAFTSKSSSSWCVTNSDLRVLLFAKAWAIRHGGRGFRAKVQIPERDPKSDAEIHAHWCDALQLGVDDVRVFRKRLVQRTVPKEYSFGTVHLLVRIGGTRLFNVWLGQLSQFVA
jgi:hypothetical protein